MIFYAISDLHLTFLTPRCRKDNYVEAQFGKLEWILKTVSESKSKTLVIGGDVFDRPREPYSITRRFIGLLFKHNINLITIPGQHDLFYHVKGIKNTPLGIIQKISTNTTPDIKFVLQGWGDDVTETGDVLITHQMVIKDKELFPGQEDYISGNNLLRKHPEFKIIISGDNHQSFSVKTKHQLLINCGSVMRSSKSQVNFKPKLWEINSDDLSFKKLYIPIIKDVFDLDIIKKDEEIKENKELDAFIQALPVQENTPNFSLMLKKVIESKNPDKEVINKTNQIMEEANGK